MDKNPSYGEIWLVKKESISRPMLVLSAQVLHRLPVRICVPVTTREPSYPAVISISQLCYLEYMYIESLPIAYFIEQIVTCSPSEMKELKNAVENYLFL